MTRAEISGALQALNAANIKDRRAALRPMLAAKLSAAAVERVLSDLKSYPEWAQRMDLEEGVVDAPSASRPADPAPRLPRRRKRA